MGVKMEVICGTKSPEQFEFDLDDYGKRTEFVGPEDYKTAYDLLRITMNDETFADDGCRNEDAVNSCIALHVLGYDAKTWFENFCNEQANEHMRWFDSDLVKYMEHVERVAKYLHRWGPDGNRANALGYII